jgi:hypothetical protein
MPIWIPLPITCVLLIPTGFPHHFWDELLFSVVAINDTVLSLGVSWATRGFSRVLPLAQCRQFYFLAQIHDLWKGILMMDKSFLAQIDPWDKILGDLLFIYIAMFFPQTCLPNALILSGHNSSRVSAFWAAQAWRCDFAIGTKVCLRHMRTRFADRSIQGPSIRTVLAHSHSCFWKKRYIVFDSIQKLQSNCTLIINTNTLRI